LKVYILIDVLISSAYENERREINIFSSLWKCYINYKLIYII
jgi:hypothetical protein